jgi:D-alanine transaminase
MALTLANWNGAEMPLEQVMVPALDRAFLFGDAVYEVIRIYRGRLWKVDEHLSRLHDSLSGLAIKGVEIQTIRSRLESTLAHSRLLEALAYIQVTRGVARRTHQFPDAYEPNVLIYVEQFLDRYGERRETGVEAVTHPDIRWKRNDLKATSLLANCMAAQAAQEAGCAEAILIDSQGMVTEGSHTSVFAVAGGKIIVSPASPNVLPGITKRQVLNLAQQSEIGTIEGRLSQSDLWTCQEVFITGTPEEIVPVIKIDGKPVGDGQAGPVTKRLQETFKATLDSWLKTTVN